MGLFEPKPAQEEKPEKRKPDLSGDVQIVKVQPDGVKQYTKVGQLALWNNDRKTGKQPDMRGNISPPMGQEGDTYQVSVWKRGVR